VAGGLFVNALHRRHDRTSFRCGKEPLDRYLREHARQDVERHLASVFVVTDSAEGVAILGYYSLTSSDVALQDLPDAITHRLPYPRVPATLLGRLAVDEGMAGRGIGSFMLLDAAARALSPEAPASHVMIVDPLDDEASSWYARFGFATLSQEARRLYLPLSTLHRALTTE
jgi:ribosomal protein S18 acetylase RimI-like enzyme